MKSRFTESATETYYDSEDAIYRSLWDEEGSVHWGFFDDSTGLDFLKACANLNRVMSEKASIDHKSKVLDLGCGNGTTSIRLSKGHGCQVVGVDLSGVRIGNARDDLQNQASEVKARVRFEKASAAALPFEDGSFTHVWSQAVLYHVHDREKALGEAYRVLEDGGTFVFDDLVKPKANISEMARKYVYDRLLFDTDFSFESYADALRHAGFEVLDAQDLSDHLKTSYGCLAQMAREKKDGDVEKYQALALAYENTVQAIADGDLGWGMYLCKRA